MALAHSQSYSRFYYLVMIRSFLIWAFTLGVCLLIIGFPIVILMVTVGALSAVVLQSIMPASALLVVAGSLFGINIFAILFGAAVLTLKGVHPHEVSWLRWLNGDDDPSNPTTYASCPLTCSIRP